VVTTPADYADGQRAAVSGSLEITLNRLAAALDRKFPDPAEAERELTRAVQPVVLPAVQFVVTAGTIQVSVGAQQLLGPEDGQVWHLGRVTLAGLTGTDQATLYRETSGVGGLAQNKLRTFTAVPPNDMWEPSRTYLRSPETLSLVGTGLAATLVTLSAEAIAIDARYLARYLI
jgi:hypothetical protein